MPKKNAFFFFMLHRKEEIIRSGIKLTRGLAEVATLIDSEWKEMPTDQKEIYKQMADDNNSTEKMGKTQGQQPETIEGAVGLSSRHGYSSLSPTSFAQVAEQVMVKYCYGPESFSNMRTLLATLLNGVNPEMIPISILQFSTYSEKPPGDADDFMVAEVGLTIFSVKKGILKNFSALIDPGEDYPKHRKNEVAKCAKKLALPMPGYDKRAQDYRAILDALFQIGNKVGKDGRVVFYCLTEQLPTTELCLKWLMFQAGIYAQNLQTRYEFYLLSLDDMIAMMTSRLDLSRVPDRPKPSSPWSPGAAAAGACASSSSFPRRIPNQLELSLSIMQEETERYVAFPPKLPFVSRGIFAHAGEVIDFLKVDNYAHREELACRYHSVRRDGVYFCPINVANRYAFNLLHVLTVAYQTCPIPGRHYPTILHDEGEERRRRRDMLKEYEIWDPTALGLQEAANDQELQEAEAAAGDRYRHRPRGQNPDRAEYEKLSDAFKDLKTTNSP